MWELLTYFCSWGPLDLSATEGISCKHLLLWIKHSFNDVLNSSVKPNFAGHGEFSTVIVYGGQHPLTRLEGTHQDASGYVHRKIG
jgi:hypothetical protein